MVKHNRIYSLTKISFPRRCKRSRLGSLETRLKKGTTLGNTLASRSSFPRWNTSTFNDLNIPTNSRNLLTEKLYLILECNVELNQIATTAHLEGFDHWGNLMKFQSIQSQVFNRHIGLQSSKFRAIDCQWLWLMEL